MKQIKTVIKPYSELYAFDKTVNDLLAEGWLLKKREIQRVSGEVSEAFSAPAIYVLYAELERHVMHFEESTI